MASSTDRLDAAWKQWCDFVHGHSLHLGWHDEKKLGSAEAYQAIRQRFCAFSDRHPAAPQHLHTVIVALSKGTRLVKAALAWEEAVAGPELKGSLAKISQARGEQWRLVMCFGGLETVVEALLSPHPYFPTYYDGAKHFSDRCGLPAYAPLSAPIPRKGDFTQWLPKEAISDVHPVISFLGLNKHDAKTFRSWAVEGQPIDSWPTALQLAKVLRNATAHGALSASKVHQWNLREAFATLSNNLGEITVGALCRLIEEARQTEQPTHGDMEIILTAEQLAKPKGIKAAKRR
jgi:hypothetical protein